MTIQEIKEMIQAVVDSGVAELEVQRGENRVRIRRSDQTQKEVVGQHLSSPPPTTFETVHVPAAISAAPGAPAAGASAAAVHDQGMVMVKAPIVGTFYEAPAPESSPFVRVGDVVRQGQVLCIIESMKLMNEIESDLAGTIVAKLVQNGSPVEYGEALFSIRPM
jgi:acetyl-CoA carboxylase biotin carboxyl carrier protein